MLVNNKIKKKKNKQITNIVQEKEKHKRKQFNSISRNKLSQCLN